MIVTSQILHHKILKRLQPPQIGTRISDKNKKCMTSFKNVKNNTV